MPPPGRQLPCGMPHASAESIHLIIYATRSPVGPFAGPLQLGVAAAAAVAAAAPGPTCQAYLYAGPGLELTLGPRCLCPTRGSLRHIMWPTRRS